MSNEIKHTPGPWEIEYYNTKYGIIKVSSEGEEWDIAECEKADGESWEEEAKANARLIAVAPELLEFAYTVHKELGFCDVMEEGCKQCELTKQAEILITKATGGVK